jgi:hypothetical protein
MMRFSQVKAFTLEVLAADYPDVRVHPGPNIPDIPNRFVVWTPYGGPGLEVDGVFDARSWQFRAVGKQNNYDSAEEVAIALDLALIAHQSGKIGDVWVPSIQRVGGAPAALVLDNADRTHFVCSYIASVELALPN